MARHYRRARVPPAWSGMRMIFAARATRSVSMLLAGLGLALVTACAPSKVSAPPGAAQARAPAQQQLQPPPTGAVPLPALPDPSVLPPGGQPGALPVPGAPGSADAAG